MPEGDTIFRAARHLRKALVGRVIERFEAADPQIRARAEDIPGQRTVEVESRGKNLLIHFEGGLVLYTHMMMTGSWHIYRQGEQWQKKPSQAVLHLVCPPFDVVCFSAPVVELLSAARVERHPTLSKLGPDLLSDAPRYEEMKRRLRARDDMPLGRALLDQRALAGIGNVYKSELCFIFRLDPFAPVSAVPDETLDPLLKKARRLLMLNLDTPRRITRARPKPDRYWVYGRLGEPCHECETPVRMRRQGDAGRSTYFCPRCQNVRIPPS